MIRAWVRRFIGWNLRRALRQIDRIEGLPSEARERHKAEIRRMYAERLGRDRSAL